MNNRSLKERALRASNWAVIGFGVSQLLRLVANIALARLLFAEAFALMAIVTATLQGLSMFSDLGLGPSVVQNRRGADRAFLATVWTVQIIRGAAIAACISLLAFPIAKFYSKSDPMAAELIYLLPLSAVATLISGFNSTRALTAARHLLLKQLTVIDLCSQAIGLCVVVSVAAIWHSLYAFPIGAIISASTYCFASHVAMAGPPDRLGWDRSVALELIKFGKWLLLSGVASFLSLQVDRIVLPVYFSLHEVGIYSISIGLSLLVPTVMGRLHLAVAFPSYSELMRSDPAAAARAFSLARWPMISSSAVLCACVGSIGPPFIDFAYDQRYDAAGSLLPILALASYFACVEQVYGSVALARGRSVVVASANTAKVLIFVCSLSFIATEYGLMGACFCLLIAEMLKAAVAFLMSGFADRHVLRIEIGQFFVAAAVIAAVIYIDSTVLMGDRGNPFARLLMAFLLCAIAYAWTATKIIKALRAVAI